MSWSKFNNGCNAVLFVPDRAGEQGADAGRVGDDHSICGGGVMIQGMWG